MARGGARWLARQAQRGESPATPNADFEAEARRVPLPKGWSGCDEPDAWGAPAAFDAEPVRLVLVRESSGADCVRRRCLLFEPDRRQLASPPVLIDAGGSPSLAPPRWTSAESATPGSCGPYAFDAQGTTFLVHRFVCKLDGGKADAACDELPGEGIGWLRPGVVVGGRG